MSEGKRRIFSREFKLSAVKRMLAGETVAGVSRDLQVPSGHLYQWREHFRRGGAEALRLARRPHKVAGVVDLDPVAKAARVADLATARKRIIALERKIGQQQVELDFFQQALRQVRETRRPSDAPGATASTRSSKR